MIRNSTLVILMVISITVLAAKSLHATSNKERKPASHG